MRTALCACRPCCPTPLPLPLNHPLNHPVRVKRYHLAQHYIGDNSRSDANELVGEQEHKNEYAEQVVKLIPTIFGDRAYAREAETLSARG